MKQLMEKNYFELFNLQPIFNINLELLESNYLNLQIIYHPDKCIKFDKKKDFLFISSLINEGYRILRNSLTRAIYLLKLNDIDIDNEMVAKEFTKNDILEKVLQLYERLNQLKDKEKMQFFINQIQNQINQITTIISEEFTKNDYTKVAYLTIELKYLTIFVKNTQKLLQE